MKNPTTGFAERFKDACAENPRLPTTQNGLGKALGVSGATIWSYRNNEKLPGMETALRIAIKCGVCVEWLLTGRGSKYPVDHSGAVNVTPTISDELLLTCLDRMRDHLASELNKE